MIQKLTLYDFAGSPICEFVFDNSMGPWGFRPNIPSGVIIWGIKVEEVIQPDEKTHSDISRLAHLQTQMDMGDAIPE